MTAFERRSGISKISGVKLCVTRIKDCLKQYSLIEQRKKITYVQFYIRV